MKKVIITGGAGFIGSAVVEQLVKSNYKVRVIDNYKKSNNKSKLKNVEYIKADLRDTSSQIYFKGYDKCIHLAALIGGIAYFHKYPADILNQNNQIYSTVFEACAKYEYKKIVYVSSSMVFESTNIFPSSEKDLNKIPMPKSSYGFSKLIGEIYCKSFWDQYKLPYVILRPFNAYGINEYPQDIVGISHVIPDLIYKILKGQYPLEILGDGKQTRSFTHVSDIARGIIMALESDIVNEDFNLGSEKEIQILKLAKKIFEQIIKNKQFKYKLVPGFKYDVKKRIPDNKKAKRMLKWKPEVDLSNELPNLIEWNRKNALGGR